MRTCHFTSNRKQNRVFYLTVVRSMFEHCSVIWHTVSKNKLYQFESIQKKAVKWINGKPFDHYSDIEYADKQKELGILQLKLKFALNDLWLFYKIVNKLVPIDLPAHFSVIRPGFI